MSNTIRIIGWYGRLRADQVVASTLSYEKEGQGFGENGQTAKKIAEGNQLIVDLIDKALGKTKSLDIAVFKREGEIVFQLQGDFNTSDIEVPGIILERTCDNVNHLSGITPCHMGIFDPLFLSSQYPDTLLSRLRKFDDGNGFVFRLSSEIPTPEIESLYEKAMDAADAAKKIHSTQVQKVGFPVAIDGKSYSAYNDAWKGYSSIAGEYYASTLRNIGRLVKCEILTWGMDMNSLLLELSKFRSTTHPFPLDFSLTGDVPPFFEKTSNWFAQMVKDFLATNAFSKMKNILAEDAYQDVKNFFSKDGQSNIRQYVSRDSISTLLSLCPFEVPGIRYVWEPYFSVNPPGIDTDDIEFDIGHIYSRGSTLSNLRLSAQRLTEHAFITGKTGSGKTNSCKIIADNLLDHCQIIVLESAKDEYKGWAADNKIKYYAPGSRDFNDLAFPIFRIPFDEKNGKFLAKVPISQHIGGLWGVISSAFPLEGPMIPLLKRALHKVYEDYGWSLTGTNANVFQDVGNPRFPSVEALCSILTKLIDQLGYAGEIRSNIEAALVNRLNDLHVGIRRTIFSESEESTSIFDLITPLSSNQPNHVVISLDNIDSEEDKSLALGLFLLRLREQVRMEGIRHNHLRRLVIIEEAHRLIPNIRTEATINPSVGQQKEQAVSRFNDSISEMRAYGVGFIIVDQSPSKVSLDVLRNIGTKIVHSVQEEDDRKAACSILGEEPETGSYLVGLDRGFALVHTRGMQKPALVKVSQRKNSDDSPQKRVTPTQTETHSVVGQETYNSLLRELISGKVIIDNSNELIDHVRRNEADLYSRYGIPPLPGKLNTWQTLCDGKSSTGLVAECGTCQLRCRVPALVRIVAQREDITVEFKRVDEHSTAKLFLSIIKLWKSRSSNIARSVNELTDHLVNECVVDTHLKSESFSNSDMEQLCNGFTQCLTLHCNYNRELADFVLPFARSEKTLNQHDKPLNIKSQQTRDIEIKKAVEEFSTQISRILKNFSFFLAILFIITIIAFLIGSFLK